MDKLSFLSTCGRPASKVLVVAAHPDDEVLGCGGTLARLRSFGGEASILLLGEGPTSRDENAVDPAPAKEGATLAARAAAAALGISDVRFAGLPDNRFDTVPLLDIIKIIEAVGEEVKPDLVFTHHVGDLNIDHALTHRAVATAFRPIPGGGGAVMNLLAFEVLSSTEYALPETGANFHPNVYVNITGHLEAKHRACASYASEMRPWPHPRSPEGVEHLARLRGSQCGVEAAEAFVLCRSVW
jgi:LmbE family N-acetylglucosaminyl deacetylase